MNEFSTLNDEKKTIEMYDNDKKNLNLFLFCSQQI